nr:GMC family oxidoreductase N-terminal domain-containing protein [Mycobacterium conspicuum]
MIRSMGKVLGGGSSINVMAWSRGVLQTTKSYRGATREEGAVGWPRHVVSIDAVIPTAAFSSGVANQYPYRLAVAAKSAMS